MGRWRGHIGAPCAGTALLAARRGEAIFVPRDGAEVLRGTVTKDGKVATSLRTPGMNKTGFVQTFTGEIHGAAASGTYSSPRCTAPVTLHAG